MNDFPEAQHGTFMRILVVDDEELARLRLSRLLQSIEGCAVVGEAFDGQHALEQIDELDPDLVFLDVRMPGMDGITVARTLSDYEAPPAVVFCTAYDEYALEAFNTLAQGYIVKPVQTEQLQQVIRKAQKLTRLHTRQTEAPPSDAERKHITARTRRGMELIPLEQVLCFVADQKYVTVVHEQGETLIDDTLKELETQLAPTFLRVHRNALVAIDKVEALLRDGNGHFSLKLKGGAYQPSVSRRHLAGVRERLSQL